MPFISRTYGRSCYKAGEILLFRYSGSLKHPRCRNVELDEKEIAVQPIWVNADRVDREIHGMVGEECVHIMTNACLALKRSCKAA